MPTVTYGGRIITDKSRGHMACFIHIPELFSMIVAAGVGPQPKLPPHQKWSNTRLDLAKGKEVERRNELTRFLSITPAMRLAAIRTYYWNASFVFLNLDELKEWIELMPTEARNHPISIEVGLWGTAPAKTWRLAKPLTIQNLILVVHPNTSMNIPRQRANDLEYLQGKSALRKLRGVRKATLAWCLKSNGARIYKRDWADVAKWSRRLQEITLPKV